MTKKNILKTLKIAGITLGSLLLVAVIAGVIILNFVIKPNVDKITDAVSEVVKDEEILKEIETYLDSEEFSQILEYLEIDGTSDEIKEKAQELEAQENPENSENADNPENTGTTANEQNTGTGSDKNTDKNVNSSGNKPTKKPASEYDSKYEYIKDNVNVSDFSRGSSLASRIDVGYVLGLLSGGLTPAEKTELKAYLKARFSSAEIAEGIRLYSKYSYLLK